MNYSFCCPKLGTPPPVLTFLGGGGTLLGGLPYLVPPRRVPPAGYPPPPAGPGRVPPPQVSAPWHSGKCCKALWIWVPPPVDRQIDGRTGRVSKYYLPVVLRTRAVKRHSPVHIEWFHVHSLVQLSALDQANPKQYEDVLFILYNKDSIKFSDKTWPSS